MISIEPIQEKMQEDYAFNTNGTRLIGWRISQLIATSGQNLNPCFVTCSNEYFSVMRVDERGMSISGPVSYLSEHGMNDVMIDLASNQDVCGLIPLTRRAISHMRHLGLEAIGGLPIDPKILVPYFK